MEAIDKNAILPSDEDVDAVDLTACFSVNDFVDHRSQVEAGVWIVATDGQRDCARVVMKAGIGFLNEEPAPVRVVVQNVILREEQALAFLTIDV